MLYLVEKKTENTCVYLTVFVLNLMYLILLFLNRLKIKYYTQLFLKTA